MSAIGEKIAAEVNRLAAENPDYIYEPPGENTDQCVYVYDGQPSCLYGQALWNLGLIDAQFERRTWINEAGWEPLINYQNIADVIQVLGLKVDEREIDAFLLGQETQDDSRPWRAAARKMNERLAP